MGQLAARTIDLAPLVGELNDRRDLLGPQRVHRHPARLVIGQQPQRGALLPVARAALGQAQHPARTPKAPAGRGRLGDQLQQRPLDPGLDAGWDAAYQPERVFPARPPARWPAP